MDQSLGDCGFWGFEILRVAGSLSSLQRSAGKGAVHLNHIMALIECDPPHPGECRSIRGNTADAVHAPVTLAVRYRDSHFEQVLHEDCYAPVTPVTISNSEAR